jgi:tetratricopeptide (TPR) repeat protein
MSRIVKVAGWPGKPRASVVFANGLGGDAYDTWRRAPDDNSFWPLWLAEDIAGLAVYTLAYEAPASNWLGTAMPLQERAVNVLEILLGTPGLADGPVSFICHSLGGLIVKQLLLDLDRQKGRRPEAAALLNCVTQVVFLASPHTGSRQGSLLDRLRFLAWPTSIARTLVANDPTLRSINVDNRGLADERRNTLHHLIFYEARGTPAGVIVDEASADPGLPGRPPIPIDADHITIVKPPDRVAVQYARARDFISEGLPAVAGHGEVEAFPLPPIKLEPPWNLVPKLVRVAVVALVCVIAFKGIQALIAPPAPVSPERLERFEQQQAEQTALIRRLVAASEAKSLPGVEKAVGEAVTAAAAGAAEGDERLAKALELLKANKTAEAAELFHAVAAAKEARIKQDRRDAAAAYRNLGAITGLADPKRALDAYRKAIELDPDDTESLLWVAWIEKERGELAGAETNFHRVLALSTSDDQNWSRYGAELGLADIQAQRGNLPEALKSYRDGLAITDRLAKADPGNAEWQYDRGISNERIANVLLAQGDLAGALDYYERKQRIISRLATADPGNAGWQRDLSVSYSKIGDMLRAQGNLPEALKSYRDGLAIADRLAKSEPGNAEWQRDLSVSYDRVGDVLRAQGNLPEALKSYHNGLAIRDRLAKSDPGNAGWQRDLSVSYNKIGDVLVAQGNLPEAFKSYHDGLAIRDRLAKSDPGNAEWQRDLSVSHEKIGNVLAAQGHLGEALNSYRDGLAIADRLAKTDPGNAEWQRYLSVSHEKIGNVLAAQGHLGEALSEYRSELTIMEPLANSDRTNTDWQRFVSVVYNKIGDVLSAQGTLPEALKSYRDGLAIADRLAKTDPGNAEWQRDLSVSYAKLATLFLRTENKANALNALKEGHAIAERLARLSPDNAQWKKDLDWFDEQLAALAK